MATLALDKVLFDEDCNAQLSVVRPYPLPPPSVHSLSNIDLAYNKPEFARIVFFFQDCFSPAKPLLDGLKSSLSKTLAAYPILAGRLAESESSGKLVVDASGQGIHFVETSIDASFRDWEDLRLCPLDVDLSLDSRISDSFEEPLVKVQVTRFRCGGIAMTVHFIHTVLDGYSLLKFLHSWAEIHRGTVSHSSSMNSGVGHSFLVARDPPTIDAPVPLIIDSTDKEWTQSNLAPYNLVTLRMERSAVEECRREAESGSFAYGKVTGFEAVSSMLWSSILRARGIPHHLDASFIFPVNLRTQGFAGIPQDYFGNAAATCQVYAPRSGDIVGHDFSYAARLINKAKRSCNGASVQSMLDWMEMNPGGVEKQLHWKRGIMSTSIANFPFYDINFGWRGGALSQICFLPSTVPPHMSFSAMLPSSKANAIDIALGLDDQDRDTLLEDRHFTRFFLPGEIKLWTGNHIRKALKKVMLK